MHEWDKVVLDLNERASKGEGKALVVANGPYAFDMLASRAGDVGAKVESMRRRLTWPSGFVVRVVRYAHRSDERQLRGHRPGVVYVSNVASVEGGADLHDIIRQIHHAQPAIHFEE